MTYMLLLNCALKLVEEIILYYDARSKKHQITNMLSEKNVWYFNVQQMTHKMYTVIRICVLNDLPYANSNNMLLANSLTTKYLDNL